MKKLISIDYEAGLSQQYKDWTREAIEEFLNLFPEYKDNFAVREEQPYTEERINEIIRKSKQDNPLLDEAVMRARFERQPDGTYLLPYYSIDWCIREASENGRVNLEKWHNLKKRGRTEIKFDEPLSVSISKRPTTFAFGIGGGAGPCLSAAALGNDERFFKEILIHELGHTFNATFMGRANVVQNLGPHDTDPDCLMYEYAYQQQFFDRRQRNNKPLFCNKCMTSMREYMEQMFNQAENDNQIQVTSQPTPVEDVDENNKAVYRSFFRSIAKKENAVYEENTASKLYKASLTRKNGSKLDIVSNCKNRISFGVTDSNGKSIVPDVKDFSPMIELARNTNRIIDISPVSSSEYQARLLICCLETNPPMKRKREPELTGEFLEKLDPQTKSRLMIAINKNQSRQQPAPMPQPIPQTLLNRLEESRSQRYHELERKEKLNQLTDAEKHQLNVLKTAEKRKKEKEQAIIDTGSKIDPRGVQHRQKTGLSSKNYTYHSKRSNGYAWKLHLDVVPNRDDPTTKAISEMLETLDIHHKIARGGENGKGMTIYAGNYEDSLRLSKEINARFGSQIEKSPLWVDQSDEYNFNPKVTGRFYLQDIFAVQYPDSTIKGLCPARFGSLVDKKSESFVYSAAKKEGLIPAAAEYGEYVGRREKQDYNTRYEFDILETYCSHKLYQKHLGDFYCGKDAAQFEKQIFGATLPQPGTPERQSWDKVADRYVKAVEHDYPDCAKMDKMAVSYTPVDFGRLPPVPQNSQTRQPQGGRP